MVERNHPSVLAIVAVLATAFAAPASAQQTAERIWSGGPILTMNDEAMRAEAVAVAGGKILAVGSRDEVKYAVPEILRPGRFREFSLLSPGL